VLFLVPTNIISNAETSVRAVNLIRKSILHNVYCSGVRSVSYYLVCLGVRVVLIRFASAITCASVMTKYNEMKRGVCMPVRMDEAPVAKRRVGYRESCRNTKMTADGEPRYRQLPRYRLRNISKLVYNITAYIQDSTVNYLAVTAGLEASKKVHVLASFCHFVYIHDNFNILHKKQTYE